MKKLALLSLVFALFALAGCDKKEEEKGFVGSKWKYEDSEQVMTIYIENDTECTLTTAGKNGYYDGGTRAYVGSYNYELGFGAPIVHLFQRLDNDQIETRMRGMMDGRDVMLLSYPNDEQTVYEFKQQ